MHGLSLRLVVLQCSHLQYHTTIEASFIVKFQLMIRLIMFIASNTQLLNVRDCTTRSFANERFFVRTACLNANFKNQ